MSKKTKTATAEAATEAIVANGIEFTPKMIYTFCRLVSQNSLPNTSVSDKPASTRSKRQALCHSSQSANS